MSYLTNKAWIFCVYANCLISSYTYAQLSDYDYTREVIGIQDEWHMIDIPDDLYGKSKGNLKDIRFYGITVASDTIEAPYLLQRSEKEIKSEDIPFQRINTSAHGDGYYYTFRALNDSEANEIAVSFKENNFDWKIDMEGSQNQQEWFLIVEDYRILSIHNASADFQFTKIRFPNAQFRYYRLKVKTVDQPSLLSARMSVQTTNFGDYQSYPIIKNESTIDRSKQVTEMFIDLNETVPISHVLIQVRDTFDYSRPLEVLYMSDSVLTQKGRKYNYRRISTDLLRSDETHTFNGNHVLAKKLKIIIRDGHNQPLTFDSVHVYGSIHTLIARFTRPASYYLAYGSSTASRPNYDISQFKQDIPHTLAPLSLGKERVRIQKSENIRPIFENRLWLWALMILIIGVLGWFSVKMIRAE